MKNNKRKNGFILLIVVSMIPLIGMVLAIMTANSKSLMIWTRKEELHIQADNACQSGLAWARQNPEKIQPLDTAEPFSLSLNKNGKQITCFIKVLPLSEGRYAIQVTGHAEDGFFSEECRSQIPFLKVSP